MPPTAEVFFDENHPRWVRLMVVTDSGKRLYSRWIHRDEFLPNPSETDWDYVFSRADAMLIEDGWIGCLENWGEAAYA